MTFVSPPTPEMIKPKLTYSELAENFALFDEWEDRYSYLIDLGRKLPAFPKDFQTDAYKVRGCMSQVWMVPGHPPNATEKFAFAADSDALIVKGLVAVLGILYSGQTPEAIAAIDVDQAFRTLGLNEHISPSRRNGLVSMVEKIKSYAKA